MNTENLDREQIRDIRVTFDADNLDFYDNASSGASIISGSSRSSSNYWSFSSGIDEGLDDKEKRESVDSNEIELRKDTDQQTKSQDQRNEANDDAEEIPGIWPLYREALFKRCFNSSVNGIPLAYKTDKFYVYVIWVVLFMIGFGACVYCNFE